MWVGPIRQPLSNSTSPEGAAKPTYFSLGPTASPLPPRGNEEYDEPSLMLYALCMLGSVGWAAGRPPPGRP